MIAKRIFNMRPILFFSILMMVKITIAWMVVFDGGPSWTTVLKEIPFVLLIYCLIEWFTNKRKLLYYWLFNLILTSILFAVIMYFKYYGVIPTYVALGQVGQVHAVQKSVFSLLDPYFLFIFADIVIMGFLLFTRKKALIRLHEAGCRTINRRVLISAFTVSLAVCLFNILPNQASMNEIIKTEQMGIFNYEAFTIVSGVLGDSKNDLLDTKQISQEKIDELKQKEDVLEPAHFGAAKGKSLIVIQMESFQNFLINMKLDGVEITPNINKLVSENTYFSQFYQQVGAGNTSDAEFVVNTSFYVPPQGAASKEYGIKELPSLPKLLKEQGYSTATLHTNSVSFWNRNELYEALGFDNYYDQAYFGEDDVIFFGASDEVLYGKAIDILEEKNAEEQPFYTQIISMTAHHPFTIPEEKHKMKLPERFEGSMVGDYIRAQNYADYALGKFIDDLQARGIWDNSMIVLYGDHLGLPLYSLDTTGKELMAEIYGREYTQKDMINIPLIILNSGLDKPEQFTQTGGQIDILPTVANLLGISLDQHIHFGMDLLNQTQNLLPQRYYLPSGSYINETELFLSGSGFDDGTHYNLTGEDEVLHEGTMEEYERALDLLKISDSYVSQLPSWKAPAEN